MRSSLAARVALVSAEYVTGPGLPLGNANRRIIDLRVYREMGMTYRLETVRA